MAFFKKIQNLFNRPPSSAKLTYADTSSLGKAENFLERFREVVADPVNLLIKRVPEAGYVDPTGKVILHNGNRVPLRGPGSYYGDFSDLLVVNRGVHEPLEEYCFQEVLANLPTPKPVMLELGSYWAHYSMWMKKTHPLASCHMVEADSTYLEAGRENFRSNGFEGQSYLGRVGHGGLQVDDFLRKQGIRHLDILHSDIQGFELEMIEGATESLATRCIDRIFISTHSEALHAAVESGLRRYGYIIEVSSPFDYHTTSCDGFILASAPLCSRIFQGWMPLGRLEIARATPAQLINSISPRLS